MVVVDGNGEDVVRCGADADTFVDDTAVAAVTAAAAAAAAAAPAIALRGRWRT